MNSLNLRQIPRLTFGGFLPIKAIFEIFYAQLNQLQRNILFTSLALVHRKYRRTHTLSRALREIHPRHDYEWFRALTRHLYCWRQSRKELGDHLSRLRYSWRFLCRRWRSSFWRERHLPPNLLIVSLIPFSCRFSSTRDELRGPGRLQVNSWIALVRRLISCEDAGVWLLLDPRGEPAPSWRSELFLSSRSESCSSSWWSNSSSSDLFSFILLSFALPVLISNESRQIRRLARNWNSNWARSHVTCSLMWSLNVCKCTHDSNFDFFWQ